jgi:regulator of protease activity HflC (stomatin/prohibitin superfamily)
MAAEVRLPSLPTGFRRRLLLAIPPIIVLLVLYNSTTVYVEPGEFAIKQIYLGPSQGIQTDILGPGLHGVIPGYERLHVFPRGLHLLEFNDNTLQASADAIYAPSINIQTSEGYRVVVDVSVAYRIVDPYKLITTVGPGDLYETALIRPRSDQVLRQKLGELNAEQFYAGALRREKAYEAKELLEKELAPAGLQVWSVMVRQYAYDERYQNAIEQRKIQDQMVFKNRAEALAAAEEAEKDRVTAEGQARIAVETQRGASEVDKIDAEADLYARKRVADGDLLVELAKAESQRMENDALSAAGASNVVGLKMAAALGNVQMIVVPTDGPGAVNPLNLDSLTKGW